MGALRIVRLQNDASVGDDLGIGGRDEQGKCIGTVFIALQGWAHCALWHDAFVFPSQDQIVTTLGFARVGEAHGS